MEENEEEQNTSTPLTHGDVRVDHRVMIMHEPAGEILRGGMSGLGVVVVRVTVQQAVDRVLDFQQGKAVS